LVHATIDALRQLNSLEDVSLRRGKNPEEVTA